MNDSFVFQFTEQNPDDFILNLLLAFLDVVQAEDWLYMDGEDAGASEFQTRLEALKSTWKALFSRLTILLAGYNVL